MSYELSRSAQEARNMSKAALAYAEQSKFSARPTLRDLQELICPPDKSWNLYWPDDLPPPSSVWAGSTPGKNITESLS